MIKEIVKDVETLQTKSERFIPGEDDYIIADLIDTANEHVDLCVGLAAIQLGYAKRVVVVKINDKFIPFINPVIVNRSTQVYFAMEGCLSLDEPRQAKRHKQIKVVYMDNKGKQKCQTYNGLIAQILQHEIDHCNGVLI